MYINPEGFSFMLPMRSFSSTLFSVTGSVDTASAPPSVDRMENKEDGIESICVPRVLEDKFRVFFLIWPSPVYTPFSMEAKPVRDASPLSELSIFDAVEDKTCSSRSSLLTEWTVLPTPDCTNVNLYPPLCNGSSSPISTSVCGALEGCRAAAVSSVCEQKTSDMKSVGDVQYELHPQRWVSVSSLDVSLTCYPSLPVSQGVPCKGQEDSTAADAFCISETCDKDGASSKTFFMGAWWRRRSTGYFASVYRSVPSLADPPCCLQCFLVPYVSGIRMENKTGNFCSGVCQGKKTSVALQERKGYDEEKPMESSNSAVSNEVQLVVEMSNYVQPYLHHFFAPHPLELTR